MHQYLDYLDIPIRSLLAFLILFVFARFMGKKQMSQLTFFDYVTGITIGSVAATLSIDDKIPYRNGILSLLVWGLLPILTALLPVKSIKLRRLFDGSPVILIQNGKILTENLKKEKFNINDLLQELRLKEVFDIGDVEFAVLETDGELSVRLKSAKRALTPSDLNILTQYEGLSANLIIDGKVMPRHLDFVGLDEKWLENELRERGIYSFDAVLLAALNTKGELFVSLKNDGRKPQDVFE